ncbi:MAG: HAD-IA family hydrolase [Chloroflexota bacterium]|nr:HAD-IA family hydrolase [Chloroflexota bacterium]
MPIRAVIFDRDGVLSDFDMRAVGDFILPLVPQSLDELSRHWIKWVKRVGPPDSVAVEDEYWRAFWDWIADDLALDAASRAKLYRFQYLDYIRAYPDSRPAMLAAQHGGLQVAVLSNFSLLSLDQSLERLGLADLVALAISATAIGVRKPEPAAFLTVTHALGVAPAECLLFDDEPANVAAARRLGMTAYLVDRATTVPAPGTVTDLSGLADLLAHETNRRA